MELKVVSIRPMSTSYGADLEAAGTADVLADVVDDQWQVGVLGEHLSGGLVR